MFAAHNFQYRVDVFFTQILMGSDFDEKIKEYVSFLDQTTYLFFPDQIADKDLYDLVKLYQIHQHSKPCQKYKSTPCRYNFGRFFVDRIFHRIFHFIIKNIFDRE